MPDVRVSKANHLEWIVWLEGVAVATYMICSDALAYASMLECDPRERNRALPLPA
ncbi:MAG: hypothetical protein M3280_09985 [Actinomycetota bacterium]|nr:hypothetical protein [Actinomycetota bacterium]